MTANQNPPYVERLAQPLSGSVLVQIGAVNPTPWAEPSREIEGMARPGVSLEALHRAHQISADQNALMAWYGQLELPEGTRTWLLTKDERVAVPDDPLALLSSLNAADYISASVKKCHVESFSDPGVYQEANLASGEEDIQ